jgi:hypothetical protein
MFAIPAIAAPVFRMQQQGHEEENRLENGL